MIEISGPPRDPRQITRHLMVSGLGFWGLSVSGACVPGVLRAAFYPNQTDAPRFDLVAADPLGAPFLWTGFVLWCISWAFVVGYIAVAWGDRHARPAWASRVLLLVSLTSPVVFAFAMSVLLRLATRDAYHGNGVIPFLPAVVLQLAICQAYSIVTATRPRAALPLPEGR